jgi:endonuclease/exonuclease/phosphatase family metal-dependent hydrolase
MTVEADFKKKKIGFFKVSVFVLNIIAATVLLLVQLAPSINPNYLWFAELVGYGYPFVLIINLLFIIYWAFHQHRFALLSIAIILLGYDKLTLLYQPGLFKVKAPVNETSIKVMSYNVRLFDLYNWTGNIGTRNKIFDLLHKEVPDIICFQEYFNSDDATLPTNDTLLDVLGVKYSHVVYGLTLRKTYHWGLATFCKYPIVNKGLLFFEEGKTNFGIFTDVMIENDTVRIYNLHLQSNHFKKKDYEFIANPDSGDNKQIVEGALSIMKRLKTAVIKRTSQVEEVRAHMDNCKYPIILCGDFNDPPFSYAYQTLKKGMHDSFVENGKGFGISYNNAFIPYRIDYILYNNDFNSKKYSMVRQKFSDHYPIISWLELNDQ